MYKIRDFDQTVPDQQELGKQLKILSKELIQLSEKLLNPLSKQDLILWAGKSELIENRLESITRLYKASCLKVVNSVESL